MTDSSVFSGETKLISSINRDWLTEAVEQGLIELEDFHLQILNKKIAFRKKIPFNKFIINYLVYKYYEKLETDEKRKIIDSIFDFIAGKNNEKEGNNNLEAIVKNIISDFKANGMSCLEETNKVYGDLSLTKKWDKKRLREIITSSVISRSTMISLSFGLGMDLKTTNDFLKKGLREEGLNLWLPDEFIVYVVKKYFENNIFAYQKLKTIYDSVESDNKLNEGDNNFVGKFDNINTGLLTNYFDRLIESAQFQSSLKKDGNTFKQIFSTYKFLIKLDRTKTLNRKFNEAFNEVNEELKPEIDYFSSMLYGNHEDTTGGSIAYEYFTKGKIKLICDENENIHIKAGEKFYKADGDKERETIKNNSFNTNMDTNFYSEKDYYSHNKASLEIEVKSATFFKADEPPSVGLGDELLCDVKGVQRIEHSGINKSKNKITSLLTYIYNTEAKLHSNSESDFSEDKVSELEEVLDKTKITPTNLFKIKKGESGPITRDKLITILFLQFVVQRRLEWIEKLYKEEVRQRRYITFMNRELEECHLYEYNISDGYEELLFKLVCIDDPIEGFRYLWANYLEYLDKKEK